MESRFTERLSWPRRNTRPSIRWTLLRAAVLLLAPLAFTTLLAMPHQALAQSDDATLSALVLKRVSNDTEIDDTQISLRPPFESSITSYAAYVVNTVDKVTVQPEVNDSNARFEFHDENDRPITDADTVRPGQQVALEVGTNTIKVRVAAEDENTTETYDLRVTRHGTSLDPTLSALELESALDDTGIRISPSFESGTTSYRAFVTKAVDEINVKPTPSHGSASIEFLDVHYRTIPDSNPNKPGQQVRLSVGVNTIRVKGTSAFGNATRIYSLWVIRPHSDSTTPSIVISTVDGTSLVIRFNDTLAWAENLANSSFEVKKTPPGSREQSVRLTGSPLIRQGMVMLTLTTAVESRDTGVKVSYTKPLSGTDNVLMDRAGNEVASFADQPVFNVRATTRQEASRR